MCDQILKATSTTMNTTFRASDLQMEKTVQYCLVQLLNNTSRIIIMDKILKVGRHGGWNITLNQR